ncbi:hypothetical protein DY000_02015482 [Brassica cretica]|uniref:Uncharacterized protein n=1 Tax=Brassica cretica TaxID=69181 RepID=A0ABQ7CSK3_BRACR|nr:hypothetical protein DY000_02015482 [Brassica cretica]
MEVFHIQKYGRFSLSAICHFLELEAVPGTDTGFAPYFSISSSISRNNLCTQVNRSCSFSAGIPQAGHRSNRGLVLFRPLILVEDGELWASDDVLETVEPGALMFPEEELVLSPSYLLSLFSRSISSRFSPYISRMKSKPDLALDFSSIGGRIRSKKERSGFGSSESMDSSGSSLDLTSEVENLSRKVVDLAPSSAEVCEFPPVGPLSSIGVNEVSNWRAKYHLSDDVVIRIPGPIERVSDFEVDEVPVYEVFFESGFRDQVPSLVVKVSEALEISLGQLNPPSWRTLTALQNLGELEEIPSMDPSLGEKTIKQVLELPIERRQKYGRFSLSAICHFLELEPVPGTDTGFAPYFSISSSISRNNLCTQVNRGCSFSAGIPRAGHRSNRGLVLFRPLILVEDGELWASDDVLETVEPGALMFPEEELVLSPSYLLSLFSRSLSSRFSPYISRMKSKPDLALEFSSIGGRIRSKKERSSVGSSESMDFSGSLLDLTAEVENLSRKVVDLGPSSAEVCEFPPVGPLSSIGVNEVANWRAKYHLSDDVVIRIPGPIDRVSDFEVDEVPVYEVFFESGFRDQVPSLVAKVSEALEISPVSIDIPMGVSIDTPFAPSIDYSSVISIDAL